MLVVDMQDAFAIQQIIARFANSFDRKGWDVLARCLANRLYTDYSDLRGTPPETLTRERFVELRRHALQDLQTHHLSGNLELQIDGTHAEARVSFVIYRRTTEGVVLNTHCLYTFGLKKQGADWLIASIVQKVLWNEGETSIHTGIAR